MKEHVFEICHNRRYVLASGWLLTLMQSAGNSWSCLPGYCLCGLVVHRLAGGCLVG
ncbi:MAG: hypothetical protein ACR5LF_08325 [Symbiopectobacterium sp.]